MEERTKDKRDVGDDDNSGRSSLPRDGGEKRDIGDGRAHARKCKEVKRLEAETSAARAACGAALDSATRTQSRAVKKPSLSVKIKRLANMLMKKTSEHQDLLKEIALERKEAENLLH